MDLTQLANLGEFVGAAFAAVSGSAMVIAKRLAISRRVKRGRIAWD